MGSTDFVICEAVRIRLVLGFSTCFVGDNYEQVIFQSLNSSGFPRDFLGQLLNEERIDLAGQRGN